MGQNERASKIRALYRNRGESSVGYSKSVMAESCIDFAHNLSCLLCDPVFYGAGVPNGDGSPVLLIPGFFAGDWSLSTLARWLSRIGYRPYLSGIDWNVGCPDEKSERLGWRHPGNGGGWPRLPTPDLILLRLPRLRYNSNAILIGETLWPLWPS